MAGPLPDYLALRESALWRRGTPIPRRAALDRAAFEAEHLEGTGRPAVVSDQVARWSAAREWSFASLRARFGEDPVIANSPFFHEELPGLSPVKVAFRLADYLDYVLDPEREPRGRFLQGGPEELRRNAIPLYAPGYRPFQLHPELRAELEPSPYFVEDLFARLPLYLRELLDRLESPVHYLFFAPRGAVAFLHHDYWDTHAYLAQLQGHKLCVLFSPEDDENLYGGELKDPLRCDLERFPRFARATPWVAELRAGDLIFVPSRWRHFVVTLEPSLTFSYDFFTRQNMGAYLSHFFLALARLLLAEPGDPRLLHARALLAQTLADARRAGAPGA